MVEAAHTVLDEVLSPEEGEAVVKAIETPMGSKGSGTRRRSVSGIGDEMVENRDEMEEEPG